MQDNNLDDSNFTGYAIPQAISGGVFSTRLTPAYDDAVIGLLRRLLADLSHYYSIEKASLALYEPADGRLYISHLYTDKAVKTGLTLVLPDSDSLLHQILQQGFPVADNYPKQIAAGVVEKKILLGSRTRSVLIVPLIHDGNRLGVLSLASPDDAAFSVYLDGVGESYIRRFVVALEDTLLRVVGVE